MSIRHCLPIAAVALSSRATTNPTTIQRLIMLVPGQMHYVSESTSKTLASISEPHSPTWLHSLPPSPHSSSSPPSHILPLFPFCSTSNYLNCIMWKFNQLWRSYKVLFNCNFYPCLWKYLQPTGSDRNLHEGPSLQGKLRGLLSRSLNWSSQNFPQNQNMILPWVWTNTMTTWRLVMLIPEGKAWITSAKTAIFKGIHLKVPAPHRKGQELAPRSIFAREVTRSSVQITEMSEFPTKCLRIFRVRIHKNV